jgi:YggT family protein
MWTNALAFIIQTLLGLLSLAFLLRFYMQATSTPFKNSFGQTIVSLTNFAVIPMRRIIPAVFKLDSSSLLLAFITQLILTISLKWLADFPFLVAGQAVWSGLVGLSALAIIKLSIDIFLYAVIAQAILSWVNPHTAISPILGALTYPLLSRIHRWIPQPNGLDLSPIIVLVGAKLIDILLIAPIESSLLKLF